MRLELGLLARGAVAVAFAASLLLFVVVLLLCNQQITAFNG